MRKTLRAAGAVVLGVWVLFAAGCGGGGGGEAAAVPPAAAQPSGSTDAAPATADPAPAPEPPVGSAATKLFLADGNSETIALFTSVAPPTGSTVLQTALAHPSRVLPYLAYDSKRDILYAASGGSLPVLVFTDASRMGAQPVPARSIALPGDFGIVMSMQIDEESDTLFVGGWPPTGLGGQVLVFGGASGRSGAVAPSRRMVMAHRVNRIAIDPIRDILYVAGEDGIKVYRQAATAEGEVQAARTLFPEFGVGGLALDAERDRLYADTGLRVRVINGASGDGATVVATVSIDVGGVNAIAFDPAGDRLYVARTRAVFLVGGASALNGDSSVPAVGIETPGMTASSIAF